MSKPALSVMNGTMTAVSQEDGGAITPYFSVVNEPGTVLGVQGHTIKVLYTNPTVEEVGNEKYGMIRFHCAGEFSFEFQSGIEGSLTLEMSPTLSPVSIIEPGVLASLKFKQLGTEGYAQRPILFIQLRSVEPKWFDLLPTQIELGVLIPPASEFVHFNHDQQLPYAGSFPVPRVNRMNVTTLCGLDIGTGKYAISYKGAKYVFEVSDVGWMDVKWPYDNVVIPIPTAEEIFYLAKVEETVSLRDGVSIIMTAAAAGFDDSTVSEARVLKKRSSKPPSYRFSRYIR